MTSLVEIDTDRAIELRESGLPWHTVAARCKSTVYLVRTALGAVGYNPCKRYQTMTRYDSKLLSPYQLARMKRLKVAGATWKELGRIIGIDAGKLERYVRSH
jgi:hypothetical protein